MPAVGNEASAAAARHHLAGEDAKSIPALNKSLEVVLCRVSRAIGGLTSESDGLELIRDDWIEIEIR